MNGISDEDAELARAIVKGAVVVFVLAVIALVVGPWLLE